MSWIYPERWSGWLEHARVGGGLFDDPNSFARIIQSCWEQYSLQNDLARHTPLTPLPQLRIIFSQDALAQEQWSPCFQALEMWFNPTLNGLALPFSLFPPSEEEASLLREPRHFFFHIESPRRQSLRCLFLLGEQLIGAIPLGEVKLNGDTRDFTITRRFGITKSSDISRCIDANPLANELPEAMREDLRYLGWRLRFRSWGGEETIQFEEVAATGRLHGGLLHVHDEMRCAVGQALTLYESNKDEGNQLPTKLRMLIVPNDIQPEPPQIEHLQAFAHTHEDASPQLELQAWLRHGPLEDQMLTLTLLDQGAQLQLREDGLSEDGQAYRYRLLTALPPKMRANESFSYKLSGQNRYGLSLVSTAQEATLQEALRVHFQGPTIVQRRQLEQDWEIRFRLEGQIDPYAIDLASLTLWLRADEAPAISIPLAHVQKDILVFRFLPRVIQMQLPLERILQSRTIRLWLEQHQEEEETTEKRHPWRLCVAGNQANTPRVSLRVVSFDASDHLVESGTEATLPLHGELQFEGHRLQIIPSLFQADLPSTSEREIWDLLLCEEEDGPRRIRLTHQGAGWMRVQRLRKQAAPTGQEVRALWLSCGPEDQLVPHPNERNPAGGPCFAFGLGWGQTQEMAQIRSTEDGFRLYRHRTHIAVRTDHAELAVSPYERPEGYLLSQGPQQGWLMVDQVLLHYQCFQEASWLHLDLSLVGYLCKRLPSANIIQVSLGDTTNLPAVLSHLPHLRLASQGPAGRLTFQLPAPSARRDPDRYLLHEHHASTLPQPLHWGQRYQRGRFAFSCWRLSQPNHPPQEEKSSSQAMLLEMRQQAGRKHFALAMVGGRLGYWSEGSAFLQQTGAAAPLFAPDHSRVLPSGHEVPAGELLVGSDPRFADLVLPTFYRLEAPLLFSVSFVKGKWGIRPIQGTCVGQSLHFLNDGGLEREEQSWQGLSLMTEEEKPWKWWRCGEVLFELSIATHDCEEYPNTDAMLSIRGMFCPAKERLVLGGPPKQAALPLLGSGFAEEHQRPLFSLEASGLQLRFDGNAMLGLRTSYVGPDLFSSLQQKLETSPLAPSSHQRLPWRLLQPPQELAPSVTPPNFHLQNPIHPHVLRENDRLQLGTRILRYRRRTENDGYPSPQDIPACLDLLPTEGLVIPYAPSPEGFSHPTGQVFTQLLVGRPDPKIDHSTSSSSAQQELFLGPLFSEKDSTCARVCLSGYSPRMAMLFQRKQGRLRLSIPSPKSTGAYHVVLEGQPQRQASEMELHEITHLHINHLFRLRLEPQKDALGIFLEGYLLAHPEDPQWPVHFASENKRGVIHLRTEHPQGLQLQPTVEPPAFRVLSWPEKELLSTKQKEKATPPLNNTPTSSAAPVSASAAQQTTTPELAYVEAYSPCNGPIHLPHEESLMFVDLQAWHSELVEITRIPSKDRLLWFESSPESQGGLVFPQEKEAPSISAEIEDEGSNFAFGPWTEETSTNAEAPQPIKDPHAAKEDDGSSFAFQPRQIDLAPPSQANAQITQGVQPSQTADFSIPKTSSSPQTSTTLEFSNTPKYEDNTNISTTAEFSNTSKTAEFASPIHKEDAPSQEHTNRESPITEDFALPQKLSAAPTSHPKRTQTADFFTPLSEQKIAHLVGSPTQDVARPTTSPKSSATITADFTVPTPKPSVSPPSPQKLSPPASPTIGTTEPRSTDTIFPENTAELGLSTIPQTTPQAYLGLFANELSENVQFGFFGEQEGWQIGLFSCQGRLLAQLHQAPVQDSWLSKGLAAIWRGGDILPLQLPQLLAVGDIILCGPAAFLCQEGPQKDQLRITRRWLWLPQEKTFQLQSHRAEPSSSVETLSLKEENFSWSVQILPAQAGHLLITPQPSPALHWSIQAKKQHHEPDLPPSQVDLTKEVFILQVDNEHKESSS